MGKRAGSPSRKRPAPSAAVDASGTPPKKVGRRVLSPSQKAAEKIRDTYSGFTEFETDVKTVSVKGDIPCTLRERLIRDIETSRAVKGFKWGPTYHKDLRKLYKETGAVSKALKSAEETTTLVATQGTGSASSGGAPPQPVDSKLMKATI